MILNIYLIEHAIYSVNLNDIVNLNDFIIFHQNFQVTGSHLNLGNWRIFFNINLKKNNVISYAISNEFSLEKMI